MAEPTRTLLKLHLQVTVPLLWSQYLSGSRPWPEPERLVQIIAAQGDAILYRSRNTAEAVTALAEAVALLATAPGGVTFLGDHYELPPERLTDAVSAPPVMASLAPLKQLSIFTTNRKESSRTWGSPPNEENRNLTTGDKDQEGVAPLIPNPEPLSSKESLDD